MAVRRAPLRLHIDRLVLDGVPAADPGDLGRAVEAELGRLLADRHEPFPSIQSGSVHRLDAGEVSWGDGTSSATLGVRVAGAIYTSLRGERR
jgi:hypothetical protein